MEISAKSAPKAVVLEPFIKLVKITARVFYDDITTKADSQSKIARSDNRGIAVVVLDALTRRQWIREEDLAKELKLHAKQLRRILRLFEEEKLVTRDHRKETAKGVKVYNVAVAATTNGYNKGDDKVKLHTHSYCCLDYAQIYDVVRYRLHRMKKKIKDELEDRNTIQEYLCPNCKRRYNALDALRLVSMEDEYFHCENCDGELVPASDKFTSQEAGDADDNARRRRRETLKDMLQKMEVQLQPLTDQIHRVKDLKVPEFGNLQAWEARAALASRGLNGDSSDDPFRSSQGFGTPMPFLGETKVEVNLGEGNEQDVKSDNASSDQKVLPPWMIKQGMNITKAQRGEVKQEEKPDGNSLVASNFSDDKKSNLGSDVEKNLQDEYVKAYYAALLKKQQEQAETGSTQHESASSTLTSNGLSDTSLKREVGMKSKREEEEEENVEWEEETPVPAPMDDTFKVGDLNMEADASGEEDDDVDWEEG